MGERGLSTELNDQDRVLLAFGYLGPLALLALVASRKEFVKWHAKQGLLLSAALAIAYLVLRAVFLILRRAFWAWIGELYWVTASLVLLGGILVLLLCIVRALEGERFKVPFLGDLADRL